MAPSGVIAGLGAVVLCGGKSSRMGRPKAWLDFGGEPLLSRVLRRVAGAAAPIVVVAAPDQELPELADLPVTVTRDHVADRGPLEGIRAGLSALSAGAAPPAAAFVSSTDVPFLAPEIVRRLAALRAEGIEGSPAEVVVARTEGRYHPLCAVYALGVLPRVEALLAADRLRPFFLFEQSRTVVADEALLLADGALAAADPALRSLQNVNTPEEYAEALRAAGFSS